jgi:hypothetical protein
MTSNHHTKTNDITYQQIYKFNDLDNSLEAFTSDNRQKIIFHNHPDKLSNLSIIESFVKEVEVTQDHAYDHEELSTNHLMIENISLAKYFKEMDFCLDAFSSELIYCPRVQLFFNACKSLDIIPGWNYFTKPLDPSIISTYANCGDLFNKLIERIRTMLGSQGYKKKLHNFNKHVHKRKVRVLTWERDLFAWRSRHLILFLTLSYQVQHRSEITVDRIQNDLFKLLNNRRHNKLLSGIDAYAWKLEEGGKSGLHVHMVMAYSSSSNRDIYLADQIGKYWGSVATDGMGQYNNENLHRGSHWVRELGMSTGQINHHEEPRRQGLRKLLEYLAKADQYLKHKTTAKTRTFQLSQIPQKSQRGRPRFVDCSSS